jgi:hypothetical protein
MEAEIEVKRPVGRPRKEDVALRAAARSGPVRERKRKGGQLNDPFRVDNIPPGISYEWKRATVYGKSDPSYDILMREQGWEPVDSSRHPELVADGHTGAIVRDGLILMERPIELTREAQAEDRAAAREAVSVKKQQLGEAPAGTLTRDHQGVRPQVRTSYESLPIDEE